MHRVSMVGDAGRVTGWHCRASCPHLRPHVGPSRCLRVGRLRARRNAHSQLADDHRAVNVFCPDDHLAIGAGSAVGFVRADGAIDADRVAAGAADTSRARSVPDEMGLAAARCAGQLRGEGPRASRAPQPSASGPQPQSASLPGITDRAGALPSRGIYKIGKPYTVAGKTYVPAEDPNYDETGTASWYGDGFHGGPTANGEIYDMHLLTAAHKTLPMPSYAYVHNPVNGRTIMVRINNRGPFKGNRIIDLSHEAARQLDFKARGLATVRVTYAGRAPLDGNDHAERAFLAQQPWYRSEIAAGTH